jgi:hypothetical protein
VVCVKQLPTKWLWDGLQAPNGRVVQARILDTTQATQQRISVENLYRLVHEFDPDAALYVMGYESDTAQHISVDSTHEELFAAFAALIARFDELGDAVRHNDHFEGRRIIGRPYPGTKARAVYCWAVAPSLHKLAMEPRVA